MISCGEPSGDLTPARCRRHSAARAVAVITGFGGDRLRAAGAASLVGDFHGLSVTGLLEALPFAEVVSDLSPPGRHGRDRVPTSSSRSTSRTSTSFSLTRCTSAACRSCINEQIRQDAISDDLANASTNGYKPDIALQSSFRDMLLHNDSNGRQVGALSLGPRITSLVTDFSQGPLRNTGNPLDLALAGEGFFEVSTPAGVRLHPKRPALDRRPRAPDDLNRARRARRQWQADLGGCDSAGDDRDRCRRQRARLWHAGRDDRGRLAHRSSETGRTPCTRGAPALGPPAPACSRATSRARVSTPPGRWST